MADLYTMPWQARLTIALGAGPYEEMLFRLVGIALVHFVLADLLRVRREVANVLSIVVTAAAFAAYHDTSLAGGGQDWPLVWFYFAAGMYFGTVYVLRGFGIVAGTHAFYDVLVLVLLKS